MFLDDLKLPKRIPDPHFDLMSPISTLPHIIEDAIVKPIFSLPQVLENSILTLLAQPPTPTLTTHLPPTPPDDVGYEPPRSLYIRGEAEQLREYYDGCLPGLVYLPAS